MKISNFTTNITRMANKTGFFLKKKSPELLVISGVISIGAAIFFAIKGTMKLEETLEKPNKDIQIVKEKLHDDNKLATGEYTVKDCNKELAIVYTKTIGKVIKLYLPTALFFGAAVSSLFGVHKILKGRNLALAAAYTALDNTYKKYRHKVIDKLGEEAEKNIFRNMYEDAKEVTSIDKDGNEIPEVKKINTPHVDKDSLFSYLFDASNVDWCNSGRLNLDYLLAKEKYLNQKLIAQGYLFLSDVHEALSIEPGVLGDKVIQAARVIGWIYDPDGNSTGDNYISFGISDKEGNLTKDAMEMLRRGERDIYLEFNPDGDILTGENNRKTFMKYAKLL